MGCDIHCYIEHKNKTSDQWEDFGGRINPGRNYWIFGALSGVRRDDLPHIKPRGIAEDMGYSAHSDCWCFIVKEPGNESGYCSEGQATRWLAAGFRLMEPDKPLLHNRILHPDWHSHSWMNADEFELAIAVYLKASGFQVNTPRLPALSEIQKDELAIGDEVNSNALEYITEYWAILASLRCFEMQGRDARLIYWFDN